MNVIARRECKTCKIAARVTVSGGWYEYSWREGDARWYPGGVWTTQNKDVAIERMTAAFTARHKTLSRKHHAEEK